MGVEGKKCPSFFLIFFPGGVLLKYFGLNNSCVCIFYWRKIFLVVTNKFCTIYKYVKHVILAGVVYDTNIRVRNSILYRKYYIYMFIRYSTINVIMVFPSWIHFYDFLSNLKIFSLSNWLDHIPFWTICNMYVIKTGKVSKVMGS